MRLLLCLAALGTGLVAEPLLPLREAERRTPTALVYLAEGGGAVLGMCAGALPGIGIMLIASASAGERAWNLPLSGGIVLGGLIALAGIPLGAAGGVKTIGEKLGEDGSWGGALLGAVVGGAASVGLNLLVDSDTPLGILPVPAGAVVGYNLFRRRSQREFGLGAGRLGLPALESYAAITESGSIVPGVRAQVLTVRF